MSNARRLNAHKSVLEYCVAFRACISPSHYLCAGLALAAKPASANEATPHSIITIAYLNRTEPTAFAFSALGDQTQI